MGPMVWVPLPIFGGPIVGGPWKIPLKNTLPEILGSHPIVAIIEPRLELAGACWNIPELAQGGSTQRGNMWAMKQTPWLFSVFFGDEIVSMYVGIIINH